MISISSNLLRFIRFLFITTVGYVKPILSKLVVVLCFYHLFSCTVPTESYDNPLDEEAAEIIGIETPALVFFPDRFDEVTAGSSISIQLYALEVIGVAGAHIQLSYDKSLVSVSSVNVGDFFTSSSEPVFIFENNPEDGVLDIYTSFLGTDSSTVSGTGSIATLVLGTLTAGTSIIEYTAESELVDDNDRSLELKGLGLGEIIAN